jgi:hypothetical protein
MLVNVNKERCSSWYTLAIHCTVHGAYNIKTCVDSTISCLNTDVHVDYTQKYISCLTENTVSVNYHGELVNSLMYREVIRQNT